MLLGGGVLRTYFSLQGIANRTTLGIDSTWIAIRPTMRWLAIFCLVTHPLYFLINWLIDSGLDSVFLRLLCCLVAVPIVFIDSLEKHPKIGRLLPSFSIFAVFVALPFCFFYLLMINLCLEGTSASQLATRQIQAAFAVMGCFASNLRLFCPDFWGHSFVRACMLPRSSSEHRCEFRATYPRECGNQVPFWAFAILAGGYFTRNRALVEIEKTKVLLDAGSYLAHELRTPLAGISASVSGIRKYLPTLVEGYSATAEVKEIDDKRLRLLSRSCDEVLSQVEYSQALISMLLVRVGTTKFSKAELDEF